MRPNQMKRLLVSVTCGVLLAMAGLAGCGTFSTSKAPIDCNVVMTQAAAGKSDTQIAADLNAASNQAGIQQTQISVADVASDKVVAREGVRCSSGSCGLRWQRCHLCDYEFGRGRPGSEGFAILPLRFLRNVTVSMSAFG